MCFLEIKPHRVLPKDLSPTLADAAVVETDNLLKVSQVFAGNIRTVAREDASAVCGQPDPEDAARTLLTVIES